MDKIIKWLLSNAIGIVSVLVIIFLLSSNGKIAKKLGALEESEKNTAKQVVLLTKANEELSAQNQALVKDSKEREAASIKRDAELKAGVDALKKQAENRPDFPPECTEIVDYMQGEIRGWTDQFSLAIKDRDDWKIIARNFELSYNNQVVITTNVQNMRDLEFADSAKKTEIIKALQHKLTFDKYAKIGGVILIILFALHMVK